MSLRAFFSKKFNGLYYRFRNKEQGVAGKGVRRSLSQGSPVFFFFKKEGQEEKKKLLVRYKSVKIPKQHELGPTDNVHC